MQSEDAFPETWMRNGQARFIDDLVVRPQDIDVDRSWPPSNGIGPDSAERSFQVEGPTEQRRNIVGRQNKYGPVPIVGLRRTSSGRRHVQWRSSDERNIGPVADAGDRSFDGLSAFPKVCPKSQNDALWMVHA